MSKSCLYVALKVSTFTFQIQHNSATKMLEITFMGRGDGQMIWYEDTQHWGAYFNDRNWVTRFVSDDYGWDWVNNEFDFVRPMLPAIEAYLLKVKEYNGSVDQRVQVSMAKRGR